MNSSIPSGPIAANPLRLYDFTHGQRRLTVWREYGPKGLLATHAALAVPVTMQVPTEPPETEWVTVATARAFRARLVRPPEESLDYSLPITGERLVLDNAEFGLLGDEVETIAEYLAMDDDADAARSDVDPA